ncbi:MAG TPA: hypothetical protein VMR62_17855 [Bryobacteraceae bacterium]|jgi:hypothetical protein|nr:hypothetical protein [Bryobacteraceae bacterium]
MNRPDNFDADALLLGHTTGEWTAEQEKAICEAAAADQDLFDQLVEADTLRATLAQPEQRHRAAAVLSAWEQHQAAQAEVESTAHAALTPLDRYRRPTLTADVFRSVISTIATTVALRLCYMLLAAAGARSWPDKGRLLRAPPRCCIWSMPRSPGSCWEYSSRASSSRRRSARASIPSRANAWRSSFRVGDAHGPCGWLCTAGCGRSPPWAGTHTPWQTFSTV